VDDGGRDAAPGAPAAERETNELVRADRVGLERPVERRVELRLSRAVDDQIEARRQLANDVRRKPEVRTRDVAAHDRDAGRRDRLDPAPRTPERSEQLRREDARAKTLLRRFVRLRTDQACDAEGVRAIHK
jgi:hypothetical protein